MSGVFRMIRLGLWEKEYRRAILINHVFTIVDFDLDELPEVVFVRLLHYQVTPSPASGLSS